MEKDTQGSFFRELIYLYNAHKKYNMQRFNSLGLSTGQPKVLTILLTNEGYVQKDLAERCMVEPATMTTILRRMEQNELIYKKATYGINGKRAMSVYLTEKGRDLAVKVEAMARESDELCLSELTEEERKNLCEYMSKARHTLEEKLELEESERKKMLWKQITGSIIGIFLAIVLSSCSGKDSLQNSTETELTAGQQYIQEETEISAETHKQESEEPGNDPQTSGQPDIQGKTGEQAGTTASEEAVNKAVQETKEEKPLKLSNAYKQYDFSNPILTQHFGADPYAMEYDGRLYIYMTADVLERESSGKIKENSYGQIKTIYVASTDDMINFTDHGEIPVAGRKGIAKWANNSWAPAACWKMIDGKPKFFLYFADNGGGIGVLTSDSPTGPFEDPIGKALISRSIPNCGNVLWLFDPAVLIDDDGTGYLYFGGGVPEGKAADPGTGRVVKLGADMISIDGDVVTLDVPYLFEDSGIHKFNNRYYYTYCTNWSVDAEGTEKYGINSGEIAMMESDSPMGPFAFKEVILKNPGTVFGLYGNNHHCVARFGDDWYIVYHARTLEKAMIINKGYRSTHMEKINIAEDGSIGQIKMTYKSREQLHYVDPYTFNSAVKVSHMAGVEAADSAVSDGIYNSGDVNLEHTEYLSSSACGGFMYAKGFERGDFTEIQGVDFGNGGTADLILYGRCPESEEVAFSVYIDDPRGEEIAHVTMTGSEDNGSLSGNDPGFKHFFETGFSMPEGVHNIFIVCTKGSGADLALWRFEKR